MVNPIELSFHEGCLQLGVKNARVPSVVGLVHQLKRVIKGSFSQSHLRGFRVVCEKESQSTVNCSIKDK